MTRHTKIIPRIIGGLGNQLFCYAIARRMALVNFAELAIDDVSGFAYDSVYQRHYQLNHFNIPCRKATASERLEPLHRIRRFFKRRCSQRLPFSQRTYLMQEGVDFDSRLLHIKPRGTVYLEGCWQSEDYFKDVADVLRQDLQIMPPVDSTNLSIATQISSCAAVSIHVRFFDQDDGRSVNNAHGDYYIRAVEEMEHLIPAAHYFIFSDQPEAARARIPLPDWKITVVTHNQGDEYAYADLWLMTKCQHFIIANSTFSWWGAWLSSYVTKQVIAPKFEITDPGRVTSWGFKGLLPAHWILK